MDQDLLISVCVLGGAVAVLLILVIVLFAQVSSLKKKLIELQATGRIRVQKLKMNEDKNHAFHNPGLAPDEELARRGYSLYAGNDDVESGRVSERQTGGQFVEELNRELENRHQQQRNTTATPPFLLQSIQESRKKNRSFNNNNMSNGRQSETNPNFIY